MYQPRNSYRYRVAFVISLIDLFADKTLLCGGDFFFRCLSTADQQLFDGGWSDFFIDGAAFLPRCQVSDTYHFEQRLRLVRESGKSLFPHEHVDVCGQAAEQIVDGGENFAVADLAVSRIQMA